MLDPALSRAALWGVLATAVYPLLTSVDHTMLFLLCPLGAALGARPVAATKKVELGPRPKPPKQVPVRQGGLRLVQRGSRDGECSPASHEATSSVRISGLGRRGLQRHREVSIGGEQALRDLGGFGWDCREPGNRCLAHGSRQRDPNGSGPSAQTSAKMPIDRGVIDQQLQALGESPRWWEQREFRDLPAVLHADERMLAISRGKIARVRLMRRSWLIVVTERRLLCLRSAGGTGWRQLEVSGGQITRVALRIGPFHGRVVMVAGGHTYRLLVPRAHSYKLSSALLTLGPAAGDARSGFRPTLMVRRVLDHVLALPAIALSPDAPGESVPASSGTSAFDERIQSLENEVEELREQIRFLEQLLHQQQVGPGGERLRSTRTPSLPSSPGDSSA
jgi:hypothetical protein